MNKKYFFAGVAAAFLFFVFVLGGCEEEVANGGGGPTLFDIYSINYDVSTQGIKVINVVQNGSSVTITLGGKIKSGHNGKMGTGDGTNIQDYSDVDGILWNTKEVASSYYEDYAAVSLNGIVVSKNPNNATIFNTALSTYYDDKPSATIIKNYGTEPPKTYLPLLLDRIAQNKNIMVNINDIRYTIDYKPLEWDLESIYTVDPPYGTNGIVIAAKNGITQWGTTVSIKLEGTIIRDANGFSQNGKVGDNISIKDVRDKSSGAPMWDSCHSTALIDDFALITFHNILVPAKDNVATIVNEAAKNYYNDGALFIRENIYYNIISPNNLDLTLIMDRTVTNKVITITVNGLTYIIDYNDVIWDLYSIYVPDPEYSTEGIVVKSIKQKVTSVSIKLEGVIMSNTTGNQNGKVGTKGTSIAEVKDPPANTDKMWGPCDTGVLVTDFAMITFEKIVIPGKPNAGEMYNQATAKYFNDDNLASRRVNYGFMDGPQDNPKLSLLLYKNAGYAEKIITIRMSDIHDNTIDYTIDYTAVNWAR
jgi:hypothetical protein